MANVEYCTNYSRFAYYLYNNEQKGAKRLWQQWIEESINQKTH